MLKLHVFQQRKFGCMGLWATQHMLDAALPFEGQEAQCSLNMKSCC